MIFQFCALVKFEYLDGNIATDCLAVIFERRRLPSVYPRNVFKTENAITLFTKHNVNRNIVWLFVTLHFRYHTQIRYFSSYLLISGANA